MDCANCGVDSSGNSKFCASCGSELGVSGKETQPTSNKREEHAKKRSIFGFVIAAVIVGSLFALFTIQAGFSAGLLFFFAGWLVVAGFGFHRNWSVTKAFGGGFLAAMGMLAGILTVWDSSGPVTEISVADATTVDQATDEQVSFKPQPAASRFFLIETALVCRNAPLVGQFLSDLENNRPLNTQDCAFNPMQAEVEVEILDRVMVGTDSVVQWRRPTDGFQGWALESNIDVR